MSDDYFKFGGKSSKDFHIRVEKFPAIKVPARRIREEFIAGRNGVLHIDEGTYEPFIQPYEIYFHDPKKASPEVAHAITEWLLSGNVCRRLEDSYDLDHFHIATFKGPTNIDNIFNEYGRCVIEFDVQPEAFLRSGEQLTTLSWPGSITNPTAFEAKPLIKVYGNGTGTLYVGSYTVQLKKAINQHIYLDCEMLNAYRDAGYGGIENKNGDIYAPEFPVLKPGINQISWNGSINSVEIVPRWWTI